MTPRLTSSFKEHRFNTSTRVKSEWLVTGEARRVWEAFGGLIGAESGRGAVGWVGVRAQVAWMCRTVIGSPSSRVRGVQPSSVRARVSSKAQWRARLLSWSGAMGGRCPRIR